MIFHAYLFEISRFTIPKRFEKVCESEKSGYQLVEKLS